MQQEQVNTLATEVLGELEPFLTSASDVILNHVWKYGTQEPVFTVIDNGVPYHIYIDGRIHGFSDQAIVLNRIPELFHMIGALSGGKFSQVLRSPAEKLSGSVGSSHATPP